MSEKQTNDFVKNGKT